MYKKRALVVISFGSTYDAAREQEIGGITRALVEAFPRYDLFTGFTSNIIRRLLAARGLEFLSPREIMDKLVALGYEEVLIQPTHILHGEEYEQKILSLKNNYQEKFLKFVIGNPLLTELEDYKIVAAAVNSILPPLAEGEGVVFMGHGSPRNNNDSFGCTYNALQGYFDALGLPVVIGVVEEEDSPNFQTVLRQLQQRNYKKVHLYPFMVVAGDHAINDMCGESKDSWKKQIEAMGVATEAHLEGMGRQKVIQTIFVSHALQALANTSVTSDK